MKRNVKYITIIGVFLSLVCIKIIFEVKERYPDFYKNVRNYKSIEYGMSYDSVISIMGLPDTIYRNPIDSFENIFLYIAPPFSDDNIKIHVDTNNQVVRISGYGNNLRNGNSDFDKRK